MKLMSKVFTDWDPAILCLEISKNH